MPWLTDEDNAWLDSLAAETPQTTLTDDDNAWLASLEAEQQPVHKEARRGGGRGGLPKRDVDVISQPDDPKDFTDRYNTPLDRDEEDAYQKWVASESIRTGRDISGDVRSYDMRGYWKDTGQYEQNLDSRGHYPDTYKKPNHITFSDHSKYHGVDDYRGGKWRSGGDGQWAFEAGPDNVYTKEELKDYFDRYEPGTPLVDNRAYQFRTDAEQEYITATGQYAAASERPDYLNPQSPNFRQAAIDQATRQQKRADYLAKISGEKPTEYDTSQMDIGPGEVFVGSAANVLGGVIDRFRAAPQTLPAWAKDFGEAYDKHKDLPGDSPMAAMSDMPSPRATAALMDTLYLKDSQKNVIQARAEWDQANRTAATGQMPRSDQWWQVPVETAGSLAGDLPLLAIGGLTVRAAKTLGILPKMLPKAIEMGLVFETSNELKGGKPGEGMAMGMAIGGIHAIPTAGPQAGIGANRAMDAMGGAAKIGLESDAMFGMTVAMQALESDEKRTTQDDLDALASALIPPAFAGYGSLRRWFDGRMKGTDIVPKPKNIDEIARVIQEAQAVVKNQGELRQFIAAAPEARLDALRARHAPQYDKSGKSRAIVDLIDAKREGLPLDRPTPAEARVEAEEKAGEAAAVAMSESDPTKFGTIVGGTGSRSSFDRADVGRTSMAYRRGFMRAARALPEPTKETENAGTVRSDQEAIPEERVPVEGGEEARRDDLQRTEAEGGQAGDAGVREEEVGPSQQPKERRLTVTVYPFAGKMASAHFDTETHEMVVAPSGKVGPKAAPHEIGHYVEHRSMVPDPIWNIFEDELEDAFGEVGGLPVANSGLRPKGEIFADVFKDAMTGRSSKRFPETAKQLSEWIKATGLRYSLKYGDKESTNVTEPTVDQSAVVQPPAQDAAAEPVPAAPDGSKPEAAETDEAVVARLVPVDTGNPNVGFWVEPNVTGITRFGKTTSVADVAKQLADDKPVRYKPAPGVPKTPAPPKAPGPAKKIGDKVLSVALARATSPTRYAINGVIVDGDIVVSTDGRRMHILNEPGHGLPQGVNSVGKKGDLSPMDEGTVPKYKDVIPKKVKKPDKIDAAEVYLRARRASVFATGDNAPIAVVRNTDGTLGFGSRDPSEGQVEVNVKPGFTLLGAVNGNFLQDAMEFALKNGDTQLAVHWEAPNKPIRIDGKKTTSVVMPIGEAEGIVTEFAKEESPKTELATTEAQPERDLSKVDPNDMTDEELVRASMEEANSQMPNPPLGKYRKKAILEIQRALSPERKAELAKNEERDAAMIEDGRQRGMALAKMSGRPMVDQFVGDVLRYGSSPLHLRYVRQLLSPLDTYQLRAIVAANAADQWSGPVLNDAVRMARDIINDRTKKLPAAEEAAQAADEAPRAELRGTGGLAVLWTPRPRIVEDLPDDLAGRAKFSDREQERRWRKSHGIKQPTGLERVVDAVKTLYRMFTRAEREIPNTGRFFAAKEAFRLIKESADVGQEDAHRMIRSIVDGLGPKAMDVFERYVALKNQEESMLRKDAESGRFNMTLADVQKELEYLDTVVSRFKPLQDAIATRQALAHELADKLIKAKKLSKNTDRQWYYHQMVLEKMADMRRGGGGGTPLQTKRSWQKRRSTAEDLGPLADEQYDYNTAYVEAEFAWMAEALTDLHKADAWNGGIEPYNIVRRLDQQAKDKNFETAVGGPENVRRIRELEDLIEQGKATGADPDELSLYRQELDELDPTRPARQKMAIGLSKLGKDIGDPNGFSNDLDWATINEAADGAFGPEAQLGARTFFSGLADKNRVIRERCGDKFVTWQDLIPDDHDILIKDKTFFKAMTITEEALHKVMEGIIDPKELEQHTRTVVAVGKPDMAVLPQPIVDAIRRMTDKARKGTNAAAELSANIQSSLKQWTLMGKNALKYFTRNATSDLGRFLSAPGAFKHAWDAAKKMSDYYYGDKVAIDKRVRIARDHGVLTGSVKGDIGDLRENPWFKAFLSNPTEDSLRNWYYDKAMAVPRLVPKAIGKWFDAMARVNNWRESIMRFALFEYAADQLRKGTLTWYGGTTKERVDAVRRAYGIDAAAALISRKTIGDYRDLPEAMDWLRRHAMWFVAYQSTQFQAWPHILANTVRGAIESSRMRGRSPTLGGIKGTAHAAGAVALTAGSALGRLAILGTPMAAVAAWNHSRYPEIEHNLSPDDRASPHLILGRTDDGRPLVHTNFESLAEFAEWFGVTEALSSYDMWRNGQIDRDEYAKRIAASILSKAVNQLSPQFKTTAEVMIGQSLFPDIRNPRSVDRLEHFFGLFNLQDEFRQMKGYLAGDGSRARPDYWWRLVGRVIDEEQNAIGEMHDLRSAFLRSKGKPADRGYSSASPFTNMRRAAMAGDYKAFLEARRAAMAKGVDFESYLESTRRLDPVADRLNDQWEMEFERDFLNDVQREKLDVVRDIAANTQGRMVEWWMKASEQEDSADQRKSFKVQMARFRRNLIERREQEFRGLTPKERQAGKTIEAKRAADLRDRKNAKRLLEVTKTPGGDKNTMKTDTFPPLPR